MPMLCGTTITFEDGAIAKILAVEGIGASRRAVDGTHQDSPDLWGEIILSCIARMKPFRIRVQWDTNYNWVPLMQAALSPMTVTFPPEKNYTTGGSIAFSAGVTDLTAGGELESRLESMYEISPSGKPVVTPGTPA